MFHVPGLDACRTEKYATTDLKSVVQGPYLAGCFGALGVEPIHGIHDLNALCLVRMVLVDRETCGKESREVLTTAMVKVPGVRRLMTSLSSSVCILKPSKAPGVDNVTWAFGVKYAG